MTADIRATNSDAWPRGWMVHFQAVNTEKMFAAVAACCAKNDEAEAAAMAGKSG